MVKTLKRTLTALQSHMDNWWYGPALALMAAVDLFVVVIPTDALLVSAAMLRPKKWLYFAAAVSFGSTVGVCLLSIVLREHGWPLLLYLVPNLPETHSWIWTVELMERWGASAVFLMALGPLMQHPAIALAAFAGMPIWKICALVFAGRGIKYLLFGWLSTHAPGFLGKFLNVERELKEIDLVPPPGKVEK
ncbi:MAG: YqaA family protein [Bacteriovoracia bacterium]